MPRIHLFVLALMAAGSVGAAPVAIGQLNVSNLNSTGYQAVSFYNLTGVDQGCQEGLTQFSVCTGVTVTDWLLTLTFTNENPSNLTPSYGLFVSPLNFVWTASADDIGPYNPGLNNGYGFTGGLSGTWEIPLSFGNPDEPSCPVCDYQITQVEFSGSIAATDTPFKLGLSQAAGGTYDGNDPGTYTIFNPVTTFDLTWQFPSDDYTNLPNPLFFSDPAGFDVVVSEQPGGAGVPEPGTLALAGLALSIGAMRRKSNSRVIGELLVISRSNRVMLQSLRKY